jgi:hypothetical protein
VENEVHRLRHTPFAHHPSHQEVLGNSGHDDVTHPDVTTSLVIIIDVITMTPWCDGVMQPASW